MKYIKRTFLTLLSGALLIFLVSCGNKHTEGDGHEHDEEATEHAEKDNHEEHVEGEIHLSKKQTETMNIQFGSFSQIKINDFVKATGTLGLPPNALTSLSAKTRGFVKDSNKYVEGDYVKKGVIMAYIENPELIKQQQEYLEVAAELVYDRQELNRQETLLASNAGIEKNVQKLSAEVAIKTATLKGIAKQLSYLDIDIEKITTDHIVQRIPLYSPMSGYITSIKMHNGMYVSPEMELMEIVNENHLHLELDVFEKDIAKIEKDQLISYTVPALGNQEYQGEVHVLGKEFNRDNKTVRIHGHLEKERPRFIKDLFLEAKIWMNDQTVDALPEQSVIKDGASSYIYITNDQTEEDELKFEAIRVMVGITDNGFTSVKLIDSIPEGMKIVTEGSYYVYAQSKAGELEHEH